jgi:hypothetical protein
MPTRRAILKTLPSLGATVMVAHALPSKERVSLVLAPEPTRPFLPLQTVQVKGASANGTLVVLDGDGEEYVHAPSSDPFEFKTGGALGRHTVQLLSPDQKLLGSANFHLECETSLADEGGRFAKLLAMLRWTMESWDNDAPVHVARFNEHMYRFFVCWLRDHTHTMKGMKYFAPDLKSAVELYAETQREDGMIFDNIYRRTPDMNYWDWILTDGKFIRISEDKLWEMRRQPVEADVEYLFLEAIYFTWKATGDAAWMSAHLDQALRAVHYCTTDPYRWSQKYQLIKRAYTIDTWDFTPQQDRIRGQNQLIDLKETRFGIMFGDNTGLIAGCRYLSEMLSHVGRIDEAKQQQDLAQQLQQRVDRLAWSGEFYRHHMPEQAGWVRDLGVDESTQVSLSNAYSLNRGISHEKAVAIIRTYQKIRRSMPSSSPGEFYAIYPPFRHGFDAEDQIWEYMNGGVLSLVAGELAHGTFEHGFEEYGVDILLRQKEAAERHHGFLPVVLRGKAPEPPQRTFRSVDIRAAANADFGPGTSTVVGWMDEAGNDLHAMPVGPQIFAGVPFDVIDPGQNGQKGCIGLSTAPKYSTSASIPIPQKANSVYLLHTRNGVPLAGTLRFRYADGQTHTEYVDAEKLGTWWAPKDAPYARVAWRGANSNFGNLGVYVTGFNNPNPQLEIEALELEAFRNGVKWMVAGLTLSDAPVFFAPKDDVSYGIPDGWGAAAVLYALVEGLAGVKDEGRAFNPLQLSPRWAAADVHSADVTIRYPASRGYACYSYKWDQALNHLHLRFTGNAQRTRVKILLPAGIHKATRVSGASETPLRIESVENSYYATLEVEGRGVHELQLHLEA